MPPLTGALMLASTSPAKARVFIDQLRIARNEKAPEMFNHFRGLVVFNNGGEIGI
ncbi:hypothetical protein [Pseudomonas brassicacearum]|uniref:hypothetical protein n=1 Tax=Pseudomonas brassicacearum TaxID=930166 RepID=UPI00286CC53D|nr:hypothetical protein [Pseudomonas brassicacearum]